MELRVLVTCILLENVAFFFLTKVVAVITLKIQIKTHLAALFVVLGDPRCE
ncbi:exosporium protein G [Bacillus cereus]|uniref:exosporium protein G n=1 Tax=Bacillus cereus TaxID=1396 RepID=UPI0039811630